VNELDVVAIGGVGEASHGGADAAWFPAEALSRKVLERLSALALVLAHNGSAEGVGLALENFIDSLLRQLIVQIVVDRLGRPKARETPDHQLAHGPEATSVQREETVYEGVKGPLADRRTLLDEPERAGRRADDLQPGRGRIRWRQRQSRYEFQHEALTSDENAGHWAVVTDQDAVFGRAERVVKAG